MRKLWLLLVVMGCNSDVPVGIPSENKVPIIPSDIPVDTTTRPVVPPVGPYRHPSFIRNPAWNEGNVGMTLIYESAKWAKVWSFMEVIDTLEAIRAGWKAQRFEVRQGDCYDTDCTRARVYERSEFAQVGNENVEGDEYWYGWSFYVPGNTAQSGWTTYGQFQQHNNWDAIWMFQKYKDGPLCAMFHPSVLGDSNCNLLIDNANFTGKWHDIVVHAKWTVNPDGFTRIYVNGELKVNYTGYTRSPVNTGVYFKYGIYRHSFTAPSVAYYDEIRRGKTREEVDIRYLLNK